MLVDESEESAVVRVILRLEGSTANNIWSVYARTTGGGEEEIYSTTSESYQTNSDFWCFVSGAGRRWQLRVTSLTSKPRNTNEETAVKLSSAQFFPLLC